MSEMPEIYRIKGARRKIEWLVKTIQNTFIYFGICSITWDNTYIIIKKYINFNLCKLCKLNNNVIRKKTRVKNNNIFEYFACNDCHICNTCFRETSRCKQLHSRKILTYKFLLLQKFPKDIIKLIVQKVK